MVPLDVVPFPVLVADASGAVRAVNQSWTELSGLDSAASVGIGWLATARDSERASLQAAVKQVAGGAGPLHCVGRWNTDGRRVIWRLGSVERAGEVLVGIGLELEAAATTAEDDEPSTWEPVPEPPVGAARAAGDSPHSPVALRLVADAAEEDPLAAAVPALFRSLDALLETIDRLVERLQLPVPPAFEPLPA